MNNVDFTMAANPFENFCKWLADANASEKTPANTMYIATVSDSGKPALRTVLLKMHSENGFVFFTNYKSRKGQHLEKNPNIAALFYWPTLERQVRLEGTVSKISPELSDQYFSTRPRGSQVSAAISPQSSVIDARSTLEKRAEELEQELSGKPVPRPPHWGGYIIRPILFEFWQGRDSRMHDRAQFLLDKTTGQWHQSFLAP